MTSDPLPDDLHEPLRIGRHAVSGLWRVLLPEDARWLRLPDEPLADCAVCAPSQRGDYDPGCRCCGHVPTVPNVLLALALEDAEAGPRVREAIAAGLALPSGLTPGPGRAVRSVERDAQGRFGADPGMACPFFQPDTGGCGIHAYRNSTCSTFFCLNDHGEAGEDLWGLVQALVGTAEAALSRWAMERAGLPWSEQAARMNALSDDLPAASQGDGWSEEARRSIWGPWLGREEAFYARCLAAAREQGAGLFEALDGVRVEDAVPYERAVRAAVKPEHRHEVPPIAGDGAELRPLSQLWYRLNLAARELWRLPLDGERVGWGEGVQVAGPSGRLPLLFGGRHRVVGAPRPAWITAEERALLERFQNPRRIDSALLDSPEAAALEDPRGFLAQCLRRGVLVVRP